MVVVVVVSPGRRRRPPTTRLSRNIATATDDAVPVVVATTHRDDNDDDDGHHRGCGDSKIWTQLTHAVAHVFAPVRQRGHSSIHPPPATHGKKRHLLHGCTTLPEHLAKIQAALTAVQGLHGREGLARLGFTYRWIPCDACGDGCCEDNDAAQGNATATTSSSCRHCAQRLFYQPEESASSTRITEHNRKEYIADGKMYEAVCRLAQEVAQECLAQVGELEWQTVEEYDEDDERAPMRILMSRRTSAEADAATHPSSEQRRLLIICTGRGKVRAGIFSRFALLCTGLEIGTAFHSVQSAVASGYDTIALIDPNVHGEAQGYVTFRKSLAYLQQQCQTATSTTTIDLLLHSASGGHYARTLLEDATPSSSSPFHRVVFTDSTHNIQWMKQRPQLADLLQDPTRVLYVRSSSSAQQLPIAGTPTQREDAMWRHRFGTIPTVWAGTQHHALTNWSAHAVIWEFFTPQAKAIAPCDGLTAS